ncbi:MAG: ABC transporter permease [Methanotrichaceae archaeon]|nr:ABC transporter permease [Methanotrichaceae archaeon]
MFELEVAKRHITSNRRGTAFTVLTVAVAVGVIIMSLGLTEGTKNQIIENTVEKNPHIVLGPKQNEGYIHLYRNIERLLSSYPGAIAVSPRLVVQGAARHKDKVEGIELVGLESDKEERLMQVQGNLLAGNFSELKFKKKYAILGVKLAEKLDARPGNDVYIYFRNNSAKVSVSGLIEKGTAKDSSLVYISLKTAQNLVGEGDVVSEIGVRMEDYTEAPVLARDLEPTTKYNVESWQEFNREISRFIGTQNRINVIFYLLIFLIAGFVVANTTIMIVRRKTKEIGMLMAIGATRSSIMEIFILESLLLGLPAGLLGILVGIGFAQAIASYPIDMSSAASGVTMLMLDLRPEFIIYALIFALLLNISSAVYPAYLASRLDPVEAIGNE